VSEKSFTVDRNGDWRKYTKNIPTGAYPVGTITWSNGTTAALVRFKSNNGFSAIVGLRVVKLNKKDFADLFPVIGRPRELINGQRINVFLDDESLNIASPLGAGNVSGGIRRALLLAIEQAEVENG
jgi:hypothetical protein